MVLVDCDRGIELCSYFVEGQCWVVGECGYCYVVCLYNDSLCWVLVVLLVDGVNVIFGEDVDFLQIGYVFNFGQCVDIIGWCKSQDEVVQFVFSSFSGSYVSCIGCLDNIGVVGVVVFEEVCCWYLQLIL